MQLNIIAVLKGTIFYSILHQKCPRCQKGELFHDRNPYKIKRIFDMPHRCSECDQVYQLEPSFFYGAMYVNYGLTVGIAIAIFVALYVLSGWFAWELELHHYVVSIILGIVLLAPLTFRIGRTVWINMFIKYDPTTSTEKKDRE
ncbi:MAG: DUF983 domain-containing protein [Salibacteraceae bacterium]